MTIKTHDLKTDIVNLIATIGTLREALVERARHITLRAKTVVEGHTALQEIEKAVRKP